MTNFLCLVGALFGLCGDGGNSDEPDTRTHRPPPITAPTPAIPEPRGWVLFLAGGLVAGAAGRATASRR